MASRVITDKDQARELGILLRVLRIQARMTQEELADRSGLSIRTISDLERGRTTMPRRRSLAMLAEALQVHDGSLERFRKTTQSKYTAECPNCATRWPLGELVQQPRRRKYTLKWARSA